MGWGKRNSCCRGASSELRIPFRCTSESRYSRFPGGDAAAALFLAIFSDRCNVSVMLANCIQSGKTACDETDYADVACRLSNVRFGVMSYDAHLAILMVSTWMPC